MNFSQSFEEFSSSLGPTDLALYAGVGIVLWVLFKDKLSPVQKIVLDLVNKVKSSLGQDGKPKVSVPLPDSMKNAPVETQNVFFDLVILNHLSSQLSVIYFLFLY
jgi:hypothetical protein